MVCGWTLAVGVRPPTKAVAAFRFASPLRACGGPGDLHDVGSAILSSAGTLAAAPGRRPAGGNDSEPRAPPRRLQRLPQTRPDAAHRDDAARRERRADPADRAIHSRHSASTDAPGHRG